jgi:WD40 repeat protein
VQGVVTIWDLRGTQTKQEILLPQRDDYSPNLMDAPFLAFTSSGKQLLVRNYSDRVIRVIDIASGSEVRNYSDASYINCIAISADGKLLSAGTENRQIITWDTGNGKELSRWTLSYPLVSLAYSPDGKSLASIDQDLAPVIWDVPTGKKKQTLPARTRTIHVSWSTDGGSLLVARAPDQVVRWNLSDQTEKIINLPRHWVSGPLLSVKPAEKGEQLILGSSGRRGNNVAKLRLVPLDHPEKALAFDGYDLGQHYAIHSAARKQWLTIGSSGDDRLRAWDDQGKVVADYALPLADTTLKSFSCNAAGTRLCYGDQSGRAHLVDAIAGKLLKTIEAFPRACYDTEFSLDGKSIIVTDLRNVKLFDAETGMMQKSYEVHTSDPLRTILSHDGTRLATMNYVQEEENVALRIFETSTGKVLATNMKLASHQQSFAFSHDGRNLHIVNNRGRSTGVNVYESATGKERFAVDLPAPYLYTSSQSRISPDGRWLAVPVFGTEPEQYAMVIWKMGSSREPYILTGHRGSISSSHFSSDSSQLITVCSDSTMLVWDLKRLTLPADSTLNEKDYPQLWTGLASNDASKAFTTIYRFANEPKAAEWLGLQITSSSQAVDKDQITLWIKQLDSSKYAERESASKQLLKVAGIAKTALKLALLDNPTPERKRRIEQILTQAEESTSLTENPLQFSRALEALELMGTPAAHKQLEQIAQRSDNLGQEAREAAMRLGHRLQRD